LGYSISYRSIKRVEPYLKLMAQATTNLEWKVPEPKKTWYQIQEGIASAGELQFKPYNELRKKWRLRLKGDTITAICLDGASIHLSYLTFPNIGDTLDVIETVIRHRAVEFDLLFPDLRELDDMLIEYASANKLIIESHKTGFIIKRDKDASP
jgi:hypothetical protein